MVSPQTNTVSHAFLSSFTDKNDATLFCCVKTFLLERKMIHLRGVFLLSFTVKNDVRGKRLMCIGLCLLPGTTQNTCQASSYDKLITTQVKFKALTHQKPPRRFCMLFFDFLLFTDDSSVVNGKTIKKKKACKNESAVFGVGRPLLIKMCTR